MKSMTKLIFIGLNALENASTDVLKALEDSARADFEIAFKGLCALEGEWRDVPYYWNKTLKWVKNNDVPFDEMHAHALSHMGEHTREIDSPNLTRERWEYLIGSFGRAMNLSCKIYLEADKIIKSR